MEREQLGLQPGPPEGEENTTSTTLYTSTTRIRRATISTDLIIGSLTRNSCCHQLVPSIRAAKLRVQMRTEIKELHQNLKTTTVYVTHDQVEAMTMAEWSS